jgi:hypothetical protein
VMRSTAAPTTAEGLTLWYSDEGVKLYFIQ